MKHETSLFSLFKLSPDIGIILQKSKPIQYESNYKKPNQNEVVKLIVVICTLHTELQKKCEYSIYI